MTRAVGYTRLSQQGDSIDQQQSLIREYCDCRGLDLVEIYDDGRRASGYTEDREAYQNLLDALDRDETEAVVVRGLSRLSRDRKHRMRILLQLDERGVEVHATERGSRNPVDLDEPWALTREAGQADADDVEKRKEAERGRREIERRQEEGLPVGKPPFGLRYSDDGDRLVPGEHFQAALETLRLRDEGASYREIASTVEPISRTQVGTVLDRRDQYEALETEIACEEP